MNKEYWLIKTIKTIGVKNNILIVDKTNALTIREAEKEFKRRNNFKKLIVKSDLTIAESKIWFV